MDQMKIVRLLGQGSAHEESGMNCQDRLSVVTAPNGTKVFCISDGCSGSKYAEIGAQSNLDVINRIFTHCTINELTHSKLKELFPYLEKSPTPIQENDFASCLRLIFRVEILTTAICLLDVIPDPTELFATLLFVVREKEKTLIGHIGDGNVVLYDKNGEIAFRSEEENGSDSSHTVFTLSESFLHHFRCDVIPTSSYESLVMFSDGPQKMFRMESGTIPTGAYEIAMKPVKNGDVNTDAELLAHMKTYISHAMHYIFDDWSIIIACDLDGREDNQLEALTPTPLKQIFMKEFNRRRGIEDPAPQTNNDMPFGGSEKPGGNSGNKLPDPKPLYNNNDFDINERIVNGRPDQKGKQSYRYRQEVVSVNGRGVVVEELEVKQGGKVKKKRKHRLF